MVKKILRITALLVLFKTPLTAQALYFRSHNLGEIDPNAKIELLYEDRSSLLWFGTFEGLFSFDGLDFIPFLKSDSTTNHVRAIYQDSALRLWVGYEDGSIYYLNKQKLVAWEPEEGTPVVPITGFAEDSEGRLWISTYGEGVYYWQGPHLYNINTDDGLLGDDIYVMTIGKLGRMWLGTDGGISICSVEKGKKVVTNLTKETGLPDEIVREIISDEKGNLWIGMYDKGFCYFNFDSGKFEYPFQEWDNGIINKLELFEGKELWVGTEGNGIWLFSFFDRQLRLLSNQPKLERAKIYDLHKDREGNIWVVSNTQGICSANRRFEYVETNFENIQAVLVDKEDVLWVGTARGLFSYQPEKRGESDFKQHLQKYELNVISLYQDEFGNLWIGTFGNGVFCFNPLTGQLRRVEEKDGLTNNSILSIDGVKGHVWLATLGGVTEFDCKSDILSASVPEYRSLNQENGLGTNFIYKVFIDSQERTWFATDGNGISVLDNGNIKNYPYAFDIEEKTQGENDRQLKAVYSITEDRQGHIWLSTAKKGIFEFDGKKFKHLALKEGVRDLTITSLVTDVNGEVLIVHRAGIALLSPKTHHLIYYDEDVGINDFDPNLNAVCADQQGNIWIADQKGLIKFTPLNETLEIHPRTQLTAVSINVQVVDFKSNNIFLHDQNNLVFDYIGLWYTDPETVKYRYKLEGFNPDWIISKDRRATYSHLHPGKYVFNISSTENDVFDNEPVVTFNFRILPPIWKRWWFVLFSLLVGCVLFYSGLKLRDQRIQRVNLLEKEKIESQFAALKSQINPHFLFNSFNTLSAIIEENPSIAVEYVEKLSDFYRSILQYRDREVISIEEEIELVKNYCYLMEKRFGDNFKLRINENGEPAFVAPLTLQILVENAIKHNVISKSRPLSIEIDFEDDGYIIVKNNLQKKIQPEKSTNFGLQSLSKRYELLSKKKLEIVETPTFFKVKVPLIKIEK